MSFVAESRLLLDGLADFAFNALRVGEQLGLNFAAEEQLYIRFNAARVRQATAVAQCRLSLNFQVEGRRVVLSVDLSGDLNADCGLVVGLLERARQEARELPVDPFIVPVINHGSSVDEIPGEPPPAEALIAAVCEATDELDFAGLLAAGPQIRASRNSAGQNHWFATSSAWVDYSLYTVNASHENKAVKGLYAAREFAAGAFAEHVATNKVRLDPLRRATRKVPPGNYRVYFEPAAIAELLDMFSWGAVSYGAWRRGDSALRKLAEAETELSAQFTLTENFSLGLAPRFNSLGEVAASELKVVDRGKLANWLVSSRSAKEYSVAANGAEPSEHLRSPEIAAGGLPRADALAALGTGLYVANLHYLNWSEVQTARVTGMTRYACFWVENGEIVAPIGDLRFDESLFRIFGSQLEALTRETEVHVETDTYGSRAVGGKRTPGALVSDFRFAL